jgi:hypothetical protein
MYLIAHLAWKEKTPTLTERKWFASKNVIPMTVVCTNFPSLQDIVHESARLSYGERVFTELDIGEAFCHPEDQYCKKIGSNQATSAIKTHEFELTSVSLTAKGIAANFSRTDGMAMFTVTYRPNAVRPSIFHFTSNGKEPPCNPFSR